MLKYDVGLALGVTTWPPGPGTVYLPLCDVTQDGKCNSTDALRILMCDVALASCPAGAVAAGGDFEVPADALPAYFRAEQRADRAIGQMSVRVLAESPHAPLGVATVELRYDPARLTVLSCAENPDGRLDLAVCNPAFAEGIVRFTGITLGGLVESAALLEVQFQVVDPTVFDAIDHTEGAQSGGTAVVELVPGPAFDLEGNPLRAIAAAPRPALRSGSSFRYSCRRLRSRQQRSHSRPQRHWSRRLRSRSQHRVMLNRRQVRRSRRPDVYRAGRWYPCHPPARLNGWPSDDASFRLHHAKDRRRWPETRNH